jgi:hypothetical protein
MRPLAVLFGIVMGSAVSIAVALTLTLAVFLLLPDQATRLAPEFDPLMRTLGVAVVMAALSVAGFVGELRGAPWRRPAQLALVLALTAVGWMAWPGE